MSQCLQILERAKDNLSKANRSLRAVAHGFKKAYQDHLSEMASDQILSRFQMDMKEFKEEGTKRFTPEMYNSLCQEIRTVKLDCEFLIFGFDKRKQPRLFTITPPGVMALYDKPGFWAIGSGSFAALSVLFSLGQTVDNPFEETLFNVLMAKFMAETPGRVGEHTHIYAMQEGNKWFSYPMWLEPTIRKWWNDHAKPRRDEGILQQMRQNSILKMAFKDMSDELSE